MTAYQAFVEDFKKHEPKKVYDSKGRIVRVSILPSQVIKLTKDIRSYKVEQFKFN